MFKATSVTDYFVIWHLYEQPPVEAIAENIRERSLKLVAMPATSKVIQLEGWVLLGLGSVVVHVFSRRNALPTITLKLWHEASAVDLSALA